MLLIVATTNSVVAQSSNRIYRVLDKITAPDSVSHDGQDWDSTRAVTLERALSVANAGDEIWVARGTYKAPKGGFLLKSGVKLYGGLKGTELTHSEAANPACQSRKYTMNNKTVLEGDVNGDDEVDNTTLIFPENPMRDDNATHVLVMDLSVSNDHKNDNNEKTLVQGFVIKGGNASGSSDSDGGHGGGILVKNVSQNGNDGNAALRGYDIRQCYFINNYGSRGGAVYVDPSVKSTKETSHISYCCVYNNVSGGRSSNINTGGGLWIGGAGTISNCEIFNNNNGGVRLSAYAKVVNTTIVHNTVTAVDLIDEGDKARVPTADGGGTLYNTVMWGSSTLCKTETTPAFRNCAYPEVTVTDKDKGTDANGNKYISYNNFTMKEAAAWFDTPSSNVGYDRSFSISSTSAPAYSFEIDEQSALIGAGNNDYYKAYVSTNTETETDITGNSRFYENKVLDIGAYEREVLQEGRRMYVKPNGNNQNSGLSWDEAKADPQEAIDELAKVQDKKGEVWIAAGTYEPKNYIVGNDKTSPLSFVMRNGINVYGGFKGTETKLSERERGEYPWDFKNQTILRGNKFSGTSDWNSSEEAWNVSSDSYHVVWFTSLDQSEFSIPTILNGVTVEGGSVSNPSILGTKYAPYCGAGIYMVGSNNQVRNCIVRYNNAGMQETALDGNIYTPQGGAIFCQGGQVRYSLIYNNSAEQGGGVYLSTYGFINNSMVANNSGANGAGVYLFDAWGMENYQILSTSVITNNLSKKNGAVYVEGSGLVEQNTIANNYTSNVTDLSDPSNTSRTSGLYITDKCTAINNIFWNNTLMQSNGGTSKKYSSSLAQIYAVKPTRETVLFYHNAISDVNAATWNNIYQTETYELLKHEFVLGTNTQYTTDEDFTNLRGVQANWKTIDYFWRTRSGSVLRNKGMLYGQLATDVLFKPSTDFLEENFESRPPVGAYKVAEPNFVFDNKTKQGTLRLYYDDGGSNYGGNGSSWKENVSSVSELLKYLGTLNVGDVVAATGGTGKYTIKSTDRFEICAREADITPGAPYTFQENDAKSRSIHVPATCLPVTILGGYPSYKDNPNPTDDDRNPSKYRTEFCGNVDGTDLSDGLYHLFRIDTGADITLNGIAITKGYAGGTAYLPYGGAMLIGSLYAIDKPTKVTLRNCILENNTAVYGSAIATMSDTKNVTLKIENCVVNNNTCLDEEISGAETGATNGGKDSNARLKRAASRVLQGERTRGKVLDMGDGSNKMVLSHVTIVNNVGIAPDNIGPSSFAAGNMTYTDDDNLTKEGANNSIDVATLGADGAENFANPTKSCGAFINSNVYLGGNANFRPLTSSKANDVIINHVTDDSEEDETTDIAGQDRNLGGAPDLGAYEAILPKAGKVIYVRSYDTDWKEDDCIDGTPNFNLLNENPGNVYDGKTWSRAIMGNAICDLNADWNGNDFYVRDSNGKLLASTLDNPLYANDYNASTAPYGQTSNAYSSFFPSGTSGASNGNRSNVVSPNGYRYNEIMNNRDERYVSGLQFAVEQAAKWNKENPDKDSVIVWVGAGVYTDFKGFVIRDGVKVYGGFCKDGNPGEDDRRPLLSQYVPARKNYENLNKADYETILQIRKETPVYMTDGTKELWWSEGKPTDGSYYDYIQKLVSQGKVERHYVLYQPDVCLPTWGVLGDNNSHHSYVGVDQYRYVGFGDYDDTKNYQEYKGVVWDGFSIRHGYLVNYSANRDGGGGVRVFRGIKLENLIVVNNLSHGARSRGGGLYMDGENSVISNSFLLRNLCWGSSDNYGGGAYMIQGVGYNMVVASNRSLHYGGGIFIESAKFYNNTVAYNMTNRKEGGAGITNWQNADKTLTGIVSSLTLYNCLVYDNMLNGGSIVPQVYSTNAENMNTSYNCYVNGSLGDIADKFKAENGNVTGSMAVFPFSCKGYGDDGTKNTIDPRFRTARLKNDFRLNEDDGLAGNPCLNGGTEDMPNMPETDMDYTDRIKDCTIDIGAYEADNEANIQPETKTRKKTVTTTNADGTTSTSTADETYYVYYVTQNGYGNRSASSPDNAACAEKLQSVLKAAGTLAYDNDFKYKVYVKVAGYEPDEDGDRFVYHANTLADAGNPQSYTFLVPEGVWLMGGYNEGSIDSTTNKLTGYNWDDDARDVISSFQTVLSAKTEPKLGSSVQQEVYGYHVVSFGKWPKGEVSEYYKHALPGKTVNGQLLHGTAGIDGVRLVDGRATDNSGLNSMGGGAVVPAYAHVRNCAITDCEAVDGGALFIMPGSIVSGSLMHSNTAQNGGAIYASGEYKDDPRTSTYRAYVASCTIADNTATIGGGIYQELGAVMVGNSVIWGNNATTDKNISGVTDETFTDYIHSQGGGTTEDYFPYNACFVERFLPSSNIGNTEMTSDLDTYFTSTGEYLPRPYSPLIENGVPSTYYQLWRSLGVSAYDMLGETRGTTTRLTAGAYAMTIPKVNTNILLTRLFVSNDGGAEVSAELKGKYVGRSFYTPFNSLDAALAYIKQARKTYIQTGTATSPDSTLLATDDTHFEILMAGGTYKPSLAREGKDIVEGQVVVDRRLQSFVIPVNVDIFGSFMNTDNYSSNPVNPITGEELTDDDFREIADINGTKYTLVPGGDIKDILTERNRDHMTDMNKNKLIEPWEFANPTILSGDIKASEKEKKVYHVIYSRIDDDDRTSAEKNNDVMLDGITIMNGQTDDEISEEDDSDESVSGTSTEKYNDIGHGGGIYSRNVSYTLNRCRVIRNIGVHGGGIYIYNGSLDIIGSAVSGNMAGSDVTNDAGKGGGVCATFSASGMGNVHAVNSLFANNTAGSDNKMGGSEGGAIYVKRLYQKTTDYMDVDIMNCLIVRNKAMNGAEIFIEPNISDEAHADIVMTNTVCWGNESMRFMSDGQYRDNAHMYIYDTQMSHCATDVRGAVTGDVMRSANGNIILDRENMTATGPRFTLPSNGAGHDKFNISAQWNPASISVLTDAGDGVLDKSVSKYDVSNATGAYREWWRMHEKRLPKFGYPDEYITVATSEQERANEPYRRYMGPLDDNGSADDRRIDIGMYEFQYKLTFQDMEAVYIGTKEEGDGSGKDWDNQSTDLRGAIIAMANPNGNSSTGTASQTDRKIYVRNGEYYSPSLTGGDAFSLIVNTGDKANLVKSVEIVGACTGNKHEQDFSKQTVIVPNPMLSEKEKVGNLLNITTNGRPVRISGLTFMNTHEYTGDEASKGGRGMNVQLNNTGIYTDGSLTLKNCAFRSNKSTGLNVSENEGKLLIYNTLFADGGENGINAAGKTTLVNTTFARNKGMDITTYNGGTADVYNSTSWENGTNNIASSEENGNKTFDKGQKNDDVMNGPNFVDPDNGDYSLRPSLALLNKGKNSKYSENVGISEEQLLSTDERDLNNQTRVTGNLIDIGAYECDSRLLPIIYVKTGLANNGSGESWNSPTNDVQSAVNLAELYANTGNASKSAYVFVDQNVESKDISITHPGVKIYGTMDNETSNNGYADENNPTADEIKAIVNDLLAKRKGILESAKSSKITGLSVNYTIEGGSTTTSIEPCVVDGFNISGDVNINNGYLSTSVINKDAVVSGSADATLYNSLAFGTVGGMKAVNVTAVKDNSIAGSGILPEIEGSANNRTEVSAEATAEAKKANKYIKDEYWRWQLNETSPDIDGGSSIDATEKCINAVEHRRDLAGNLRLGTPELRPFDTKVDNGCFETWHLPKTYLATAMDYPHGKSVIYVDGEDSPEDVTPGEYTFHELRLDDGLYTKANPFSPGFLLLGHHAGLRGNGNSISLTDFAIERELKSGMYDMCVTPFTIARQELYIGGVLQSGMDTHEGDSTKNYYSEYTYNGQIRAAYDYKFDSENSKAWMSGVLAGRNRTDGMMIKVDLNEADKDKDAVMRFYGSSYTENNTSAVTLTQYNFQQPWADPGTDGVKFTHKENMGWNLFGSPYLCAMNYSDMQYGRMVYINNTMYDGSFKPVNTDEVTEGFIPAFDALFTQTATLRTQESFTISHSHELSGKAYQDNMTGKVALILSKGDKSRAGGANSSSVDELQLKAVDSAASRSYFDVSTDGVKWMADGRPQIYAENGDARYSLLSAVNIDGTVSVGVSLPDEGTYTISIPDDMDTSCYEAVMLKDSETGKSVNLLDRDYSFHATGNGEQNNRFSVSFHMTSDDEASTISVIRIGNGKLKVRGLRHGDNILIHSSEGTLTSSALATSESLSMYSGMHEGTAIIEVIRNGKRIYLKKFSIQ